MSRVEVIGNATLYLGDCLDVLAGMASESVDSIVTDPPYGLAFMGKRWDYDVPATAVWAECLRVLKPGGYLLAFAGTRTQHRMCVRIEDAGFEIRDMIAWVYGSGFPKSHNGEWGGTALKPAMEPITVARKPLIGTVEANWRQHGTGALNIDGCRVPADESTVRVVSRAFGSLHDGREKQGGEAGTYGSTAGRWPANVLHDGSDEVLAAFPQAPGQLAKASTSDTQRAGQNAYGVMARGSNGQEPRADAGSAARFFYCAKASKADRDEGLDGFAKASGGMVSNTSGQRMTRRDEGYEVAARANNHPTVKPTALMRWLCRLVTPPGGIVLDPFTGSGSTGKAAMLEGFRFAGIEREAEYVAIACGRVVEAQRQVEVLAAAAQVVKSEQLDLGL
jgi:DNA modification methylase